MFFPSAAQKALHFVCFGVVENPLQQVTHEPSAQHCEHWSLFTGVAQLFVQAAIAELAKANPSTAVNATHTIHLFLVVMILTAFLQGFQKNIPRLRNLPPPPSLSRDIPKKFEIRLDAVGLDYPSDIHCGCSASETG